ncbi:MAG: hypothetical protein H6977_01950 [Gammaproteobacteria bacterium]|nr:hypothetical protein [Gammaproteobacteria bacterium]
MNRLSPAATPAAAMSARAGSATTSSARPDDAGSGLVRRLFGDDGFTFGDLVDLVNPLQHIPVLGSYYRKWTGDTIAPALRIAGGALFGGPIGAGFAAAGLAVEAGIRGALDLPAQDAAPTTAVADAATAPVSASAAGPAGAPRPPPPGGWMVALARPLAAAAGESVLAEVGAAEAQRAAAAPGGWLVTASRVVAPEALAPAAVERVVATARPAPGGWMVAGARPWPAPPDGSGRDAAWAEAQATPTPGRHVDTRA